VLVLFCACALSALLPITGVATARLPPHLLIVAKRDLRHKVITVQEAVLERLVGDYSQARDNHTQALTLAQHLGDRPGEVLALWGLGHVDTDTAERDQACELWRKALVIYKELGVPFAETVRAAMRQLNC
jgi:hypothetical protein